MKARILLCIVPLVVLLCTLPATIQAQRDNDPCRLFANGTKLRHPEDCSQEIVCTDFKSVAGTKCTGSKPFYDKDTYKCVPHLTDHSTCEISCNNMSGKFVQDPKSCYGYYYCQDEELALYGHCPQNLHFNEIQQACIYDFISTCRINKLNFCAIVKKDVKFMDEANCGKYYECVENKKTKNVTLEHKLCDTKKMFYNPAVGDCVAGPIAGCHPVPKDICKKVKKNEFVSDTATCGGMFYCADEKDENPQWYQCPDNKFFSAEQKKCLDPLQVNCDKDRCEGSKRTFVVSNKSGCRDYVVCKDGVKVGEGSCGNTFFDEINGVCTPTIMTYPACYHK
ncbi:peritrophin-44 [Calliphora vicina]|uniref:peritrophin-44 n=1 Tax=Calliphora vicina TaxID=7373 RepID=UPI00325AA0DD